MGTVPFAFRVKNYRCFDEFAGFDELRPINIIIGRNNSGKSALLDLVRAVCMDRPTLNPADAPSGTVPRFQMSVEISEQVAKAVFPEHTFGGSIKASNHWIVGARYVGRRIQWEQPNDTKSDSREAATIGEDLVRFFEPANTRQAHENRLASVSRNPLQGRIFTRLAAERDIRPESDSGSAMQPQPNGTNVTNLIQRIYNESIYDRALIEEQLLEHLNAVVGPDYKFDEIVPRRFDDGTWGLFLRESAKGLIALSASGSGLKTVLCVLASMLLWPAISKRPRLKDYVFGLEELENSLHPALIRRLFGYVSRRVVEEDSHIFLTTHSSVAIDMFAGDDSALIVHTLHVPTGRCIVKPVSEYLHRRAVLSDLDVRASDLLQANGVVWVEGPSDRTYVNHWISQASEGRLREGTHYQCVFYGGKLLAHLSAADPETIDDAVAILRVNGNAAVLIDSDRCTADAELNRTKRRLITEVEGCGGFIWVTSGREIENYLPKSAVDRAGEVDSRPLRQFEDIRDVLNAAQAGAGERFERSKAVFAAKAVEAIALDEQKMVLDWADRIEGLCARISAWNRMG
jgi:putative ATP-dependent endonuclease of the OLD family